LLGIGDDPAGRKILPQYLPKSHANARPEVEILLDAPPDCVVSQSAIPVPCLGLHVSPFVSKSQKTSKPAKKVTIPCSARSGIRLYKGKHHHA
jgi:hypothetical protein